MKGLLTDVNVQGLLPALQLLLDDMEYTAVLQELGLSLYRFPDFHLPRDLDDRSLWNF